MTGQNWRPMARDNGTAAAPPARRATFQGPETRPNPWGWAGLRISAHDHTRHAGHRDREMRP